MGQEFAASSPFLYFTDHSPELGRLVTHGRRAEFAAYKEFCEPEHAERIPDPQRESTFRASIREQDEAARSPGKEIQALYRELLRLRREDSVINRQDRHAIRVCCLSHDMLAVHLWHGSAQRLLIVNFGAAARVRPSEIAGAPESALWRSVINTGDPRFGGSGSRTEIRSGSLAVGPRSAVLLAADVSM